jgi:DNA-directed RNA polymerase subunit RPC12/RpoP
VDLVEKLETERNAWRFKAGELEGERNRLQGQYDALQAQYRRLAKRTAELAAQTGERHCPECGSSAIQVSAGDCPTGATAMDGADDTQLQYLVVCLECGHNEEVAP